MDSGIFGTTRFEGCVRFTIRIYCSVVPFIREITLSSTILHSSLFEEMTTVPAKGSNFISFSLFFTIPGKNIIFFVRHYVRMTMWFTSCMIVGLDR
jgi:hypothetical protein